MLYSRECCQTFRRIPPNIPGNVLKHSWECPQTFRGMSPNILGNVIKHSGECRKLFCGMSPNIPGNVLRYSGECHQTFRGMSSNIPGNVPLPHCFYTLVLWQQGKYIWLLWGIKLGPLRWELATTTIMLQAMGEFSRHIILIFS